MTTLDRSIKTLLFDWDGTLVDSAGLGLGAFQKAFAELGFEFRKEIYDATYSPNWYSTYESLGLPKEKWRVADDLWIKHYGEETAMLVEGGRETILDLRHKGYRLGVVSSGSYSRVGREIQVSGLSEIFEVVICNEHIINKKPHPEGLELAMRNLTCHRRECCYVGDAPEDIQMGKRANVLTVGVRSTYPSSARLLDEQPDIYIESLSELTSHF
jgi:phosphoglycolate phosphatase-like HAD superfamily hydrolase